MRTIKGRAGIDLIHGSAFADSILGGAGNDALFGNGGNDFLYGEAGNDRLQGGAGNDVLSGGDGNDILSDFTGSDKISGGNGYDTLDYSGATAGRGVDVFLQLGYGGRDAAGDTYSSIENVTGTKFQDFLWGDNNTNVFNGGAGNDFMRSFGGNDSFIGGTGNDEMYGDDGNDTFRVGDGEDIVVGGAGSDWITLVDEKQGVRIDFANDSFSGPLVRWGKTGQDQLDSDGLRGTNFDDYIDIKGASAGLWNIDSLDGGLGNDVLRGAKTYFGGYGEDTIKLSVGQAERAVMQLDKGYDKVSGFNATDGDTLLISKTEFGLKTDAGGNAIYTWVEDTDAPLAHTTGPTFIYEKTTQILWFDADGTGSSHAPIALAGFYAPQAHIVQADLAFF